MNVRKTVSKFKNFLLEFGVIGSMAGFTTVMPIVGSTLLLTTMYNFSPWLQENQEIGFLIFVSFMTIFSGLALLATNILGIVSGFAFDFQIGLLAYLTGICGASTVMYILSKRYASASLRLVIENKPKLRAIQKALLNENVFRTLFIIMLIRLSPAVPFAVTNFLVSASGISFRIFILGTIIGMLPRASAVVFVGSSLSELNFNEPQESWIIILGIVATILVVFLISMISKRALQNLTLHNSSVNP